MKHLLTLFEVSAAEIETILTIADDLQTKLEQGIREPLLAGRVLALLFEKPSLRTRVSFETGIAHLGGSALFLGADVGWGERESVADFTQVLSGYVDAIVCRAKSHQKVESLAAHATCHVINGLTDLSHPCQALADLYTMRQVNGALQGQKLAYIGDANNVANSLLLACGKLGVAFSIASPTGYQFEREYINKVRQAAPDLKLTETADPIEAVDGATAIYTDVWASMGQESEQEKRKRDFADYQVHSALFEHAAPGAIFLHCLPARRGEEVTDGVIDGPHSQVIRQAANRMHVQKGLLVWMMGAQA